MRHLLLPMLLITAACNESTINYDVTPPRAPRPGTISGRVCHPSGSSWLADAMVYTNIMDADGKVVDVRQAFSDRDGYWSLVELDPNREYTVYIQSGTQFIFEETFWVGDDEHIILP